MEMWTESELFVHYFFIIQFYSHGLSVSVRSPGVPTVCRMVILGLKESVE